MVLSHRTARMCFRAPQRPDSRGAIPAVSACLRPSVPDVEMLDRARACLIARGVPEGELAQVDVLVPSADLRRRIDGAVPHVWPYPIPAHGLWRLEQGLFVVHPALCAQQAAVEMNRMELVEYLIEMCARYDLPIRAGDEYVERHAPLAVQDLALHVAASAGQRGIRRLRRALPFVCDGARSPMETALYLMLRLPRCMGGAHLVGLELAHRMEVTGKARDLTGRAFVECDAFLATDGIDFEYNGIVHEDEEMFTSDEERRRALEAMGYNVLTVTRHALFDARRYRRLLTAVLHRVGLNVDRLPDDYWERAEALRRFAVRGCVPRSDSDIRSAADWAC